MLLISALLLLACPAAAQDGADVARLEALFEEGSPAFTAEEVTAWVKELIPLVEKGAGRKFRQQPVVRLAKRDEVFEALTRDLVPQYKSLNPGWSDGQVRDEATRQARPLAMCFLGKYGFTDGTVYLLAGNVKPLFKLCDTDEKLLSAIVKLVVAHELTHALQDQELDLKTKLAAIKSVDASLAISAAMEGHAVFVQDSVGQALELDAAVLETSRLFSAGAVKFHDPALEIINRVVASQYDQVYLGGRDFIRFHHEKGGNDRVWEVLAHPPASTAMVRLPATYAAVTGTSFDYAKILDGLQGDFGKADWVVQNTEVGEFQLRSIYGSLDEEKVREIVSHIDHVQALVFRTSDGKRMGNVSLFVLDDEHYAPTLVAAVESLAKKNIADLEKSDTLAVEQVKMDTMTGVPGTVARRVSFVLRPKAVATISFQHVFVRIGRGPLLIELYDMNGKLDDAALVAIAEKVLKRYATARQ
jgi:hypothetical protein